MNKELVLGYIDTVKALCVKTNQRNAFTIFSLIEHLVNHSDDDNEETLYITLKLIQEVTIQTEENYNLTLASKQPNSDLVKKIHYSLMELDNSLNRKLKIDEIGGAIGMELQKFILKNGGSIDEFNYGIKTGIEIINETFD
jgi:hypothetical protein